MYHQVWQAGAMLLPPVQSVGVMGDERTYEFTGGGTKGRYFSVDGMTADWSDLPIIYCQKYLVRLSMSLKE